MPHCESNFCWFARLRALVAPLGLLLGRQLSWLVAGRQSGSLVRDELLVLVLVLLVIAVATDPGGLFQNVVVSLEMRESRDKHP